MPEDVIKKRERDRKYRERKKQLNELAFLERRKEISKKSYTKKMNSISLREQRKIRRQKTTYQRIYRQTKRNQISINDSLTESSTIQSSPASSLSHNMKSVSAIKRYVNMT